MSHTHTHTQSLLKNLYRKIEAEIRVDVCADVYTFKSHPHIQFLLVD